MMSNSTPERLHILHIVPYFNPAWAYGGPVHFAYELNTRLVERGHDVLIYTTDALDATRRSPSGEQVIDGVKVRRFPNLSNKLAWNRLFIPLGFGRGLPRLMSRFDVIHLHEFRTLQNVFALPGLRKYDLPYIVMPQGGLPPELGRTAIKHVYDTLYGRRLLQNASRLHALTDMERQQYLALGVADQRIIIIPNGIDVTAFDFEVDIAAFKRQHSIPEGRPVVGFLARLNRIKGPEFLVEAFALATRYNYMTWELESPIFPLVRATGLNVKDWQDLILVNQVGKRFYDETKGDYPHGNVYNEIRPYTPHDYHNNENIKFNPTKYNFFNAAVAMNEYSEPPDYSAGPVWAIFDAGAVEREKWKVAPPHVDPDGYFFSAQTLAVLAAAIKNPYQAKPVDGATLQATVDRYNSFVDSGADLDFGKPAPKYKIQTPPFYAAWATPLVHDTRAGLRINGQCRVMDMNGQVIPGLYCAGESAGGFNQHGLGRCTTQGYIAGKNAAAEKPAGYARSV